MGRSQWVCIVEGCKANPSKRNNIERHVWLQHARKWHYGDKPEPYSVADHKHIVEPYIRRQRGPDGSTPSPLTPPFTPPGSPSSKNKLRTAVTPADGMKRDGADASAPKYSSAAPKHAVFGGPIRVITPSVHTPQPTPHGSPLATKGGRPVTGTKSAPGSPYARRARREDLQQLNSSYNYQAYLASGQARQAQQATPYLPTFSNVMYNMGGAIPAQVAPIYATPFGTAAAPQAYLQAGPSATQSAPMTAASSPAVTATSANSAVTAADMAAAAPHVQQLLLNDATLAPYGQPSWYALAGVPQPTQAAPSAPGANNAVELAASNAAAAAAMRPAATAAAGNAYNLQQFNVPLEGIGGMEALIAACDNDIRTTMGPETEQNGRQVWRPY